MKLASALSSDFDDGVRSRGASYFRSGAVRLLVGSASEVEARVRGSRVYDVGIAWDSGMLILFCDCPYFDSGLPCKHLWATILASDAKGCLTSMTRFDPKTVMYDFPEAPVDEDDEDEVSYGDEEDDIEEEDRGRRRGLLRFPPRTASSDSVPRREAYSPRCGNRPPLQTLSPSNLPGGSASSR